MILSAEQIEALDNGETISVKIHDRECVVVQKHVFERLKAQMFDDMTPREAYPAVLKAIDKDDESPDQYLEYLQDS